MTWDQFLEQLAARGWTQRDFAIQADTDPAVVSRWRHAKRGIPRWVELWLTQQKPRRPTAARSS